MTLRLSPLHLFLCGSRNCSTNMASDSDGDEDFVTYGTPLEPLEEGIFELSASTTRPLAQAHVLVHSDLYALIVELRRIATAC